MPKLNNIHPFLFAIFPVMFLYSENIHLLPITEIILPSVIVVGLSTIAYFSMSFILKNKIKAAFLVTLFLNQWKWVFAQNMTNVQDHEL